ncbi:MAG: penicillin-binding transpeptidase domain-containing protein [Myxococcota bacterium]
MKRAHLQRRIRRALWLGFATGVVVLLVRTAFFADVAWLPGSGSAATARPDSPPEPRVWEVRDDAPPVQTPPTGAPAGPATAAPPRPAPWSLPAGRIDVREAQAVDGRLVQDLRDGTRVTLTLDPGLQRAGQRALERFQVDYGVVVALRPRTGEILALAEHAEGRPELRQMALQAQGPAASIFKIVTAAALLDRGGLTVESRICTHGGHRNLELYHLRDNPRRDTRCETLAEAFGHSSNVAFARWADRLLGPADLQQMAERFLFNRRLPFLWGVDMSRAQIPTGSRLGLARAAAGFTGTTLSPLHAALIAGAVANRGEMMAPRLVSRAARGEEALYEAEPATLGRVIDPDVAEDLARVMVSTTTTGTASKFFQRGGRARIPGVDIAGKTGTLSSRDAGVARHYSWFVAFAPAEAADIAVAGLVVNGETWRTKGVVVARDVLDAWADGRE